MEGIIPPTHLPVIILYDFINRYCDRPGSNAFASQAKSSNLNTEKSTVGMAGLYHGNPTNSDFPDRKHSQVNP